ncbi:MAG: tRNA (adenosine(37)-N6)-dimethylallyltransferase MiaA, partial [Flavobacteriales bacterium]
ALRFGSAIINGDSRQFYREMRIGTARPTRAEQEGVPHYLLGDRSIDNPLSAGRYEREALELLEKLFRDHRILFLVGGSGLYLNALLQGLDRDIPAPDPELRDRLSRLYESEGTSPLLRELQEKDPEHYQKVDRANPRRLIRALEVIRTSGKPFSAFHGSNKAERAFSTLKVGLWTEREELHHRIADRVGRMFDAGLLEEAQGLLPYEDRQLLQTVGYQELFPYIKGERDLETARALIERNTRRYAKRQMTWFRKDPETLWFKPDEEERIVETIEERTGLKARPDPTPSDT